eukprot:92765-Amphidinium_carterae.1
MIDYLEAASHCQPTAVDDHMIDSQQPFGLSKANQSAMSASISKLKNRGWKFWTDRCIQKVEAEKLREGEEGKYYRESESECIIDVDEELSQITGSGSEVAVVRTLQESRIRELYGIVYALLLPAKLENMDRYLEYDKVLMKLIWALAALYKTDKPKEKEK